LPPGLDRLGGQKQRFPGQIELSRDDLSTDLPLDLAEGGFRPLPANLVSHAHSVEQV